ncbi:MAG: VacJ family lipoprotein [Candidatus Kuenenia sp.]|nr:VacJ family lipoprotein [Candidatus Kuenenia hertensis]
MKTPVLLSFIFILAFQFNTIPFWVKTTTASEEQFTEALALNNEDSESVDDSVNKDNDTNKNGETADVEMEVVFVEDTNNTSEEISSNENNNESEEITLETAETEVSEKAGEEITTEEELTMDMEDELTLEEELLGEEEEQILIKDSIEPFNRAMFAFNDKFYYYFFKPVYKGYRFAMPEPARKGVRNFYTNLQMPGRFFNCLFQGKGKGAGTELLRFTINSTLGLAGFFDVAKAGFDLKEYDEDVGQTLAKARMDSGTYIVLPFFGPSNVRDTFGLAGDTALNPITWVTYFFLAPIEGFGIKAYDVTNTGSLEAEETYEKITKPALDPYIALQDAYTKNRIKKINE